MYFATQLSGCKCAFIKLVNYRLVQSDIIVHVNMTSRTVEDPLPIKTSKTEKNCIVEKMIAKFSARQWKWYIGLCCLISYK